MSFYIETKATFDKILDNGSTKKVTQSYLVDALSFAEAEARITDELKAFVSGDFEVAAVKKSNIAEVFRSTGDRWYKVKAMFISLDEKTAAEKKSATHYLVQAPNFEEALDYFLDGMKGTVADFEIAAIDETPIMDVYDYIENK